MSSATVQYFARQGSPIVAIATAMGGPVAIIRISGKDLSIYNSLFSKSLIPGQITYTKVANLDKAVVLFFKSPHSFTGEDVIEVQTHGVRSLVDGIVAAFINHGASHALPGEFSFRAVLNNKMTLEESEALNTALSDSSLNVEWAKKLVGISPLGEEAAKSRIKDALLKISSARGRVEAAIDYPEAEAEQSADVEGATELISLAQVSIGALMTAVENFSKKKSGLRMLILGSPNVGKSTLLNLLAGGERSLVSSEAGTTRDFVESSWRLSQGTFVTSIDTAGIRFGADVGKVEESGVQRALLLAEEADAILVVRKFGEPPPPVDLSRFNVPILEIYSHRDKIGSDKINDTDPAFDFINEGTKIQAFLDKWLSKILISSNSQDSEFWISKRQGLLIASASASLNEALKCLNEEIPIELCGQFLLEAEKHLRMSIGENVSDEYIGQIFSQFCLGK